MDESERLIAVAALSPGDAAVSAWNTWRSTASIAEASSLLTWAGGYIHRNLRAAGVDDPYLRGIHRHNVLANGARIVAALPVIRELTRRWTVTPMKSFGMSGGEYSRGMRPMADFDFYVPVVDALDVAGFLVASGLPALMGVYPDEFVQRILAQRGSWNFKSGPVDLDLHWRLLEHLDTDVSEALVSANSSMTETEFGRVRKLDPELMLICLAVHHQMQTGGSLHGVFDFAHLLDQVDPDRAARLAVEAGASREVAELLTVVNDLAGGEPPGWRPFADALARSAPPHADRTATHVVSRLFEPLPSRYFEPAFLRHPRLYRAWFAAGRWPVMERAMIRIAGVVTREVPQAIAAFPRITGRLGVGWHHLYPGDPFRWANLPDTRVLFPVTDDGVQSVRIVLDPTIWPLAPVESFGVFWNGRRIGVCERSASDFTFILPRNASGRRGELSLRVMSRRRYSSPGIYVHWFRMLAPVVGIELVGGPGDPPHPRVGESPHP